jgi:hypothetical protein
VSSSATSLLNMHCEISHSVLIEKNKSSFITVLENCNKFLKFELHKKLFFKSFTKKQVHLFKTYIKPLLLSTLFLLEEIELTKVVRIIDFPQNTP